MVLAAGLATRLHPLSREVPKAALPVLNRPLAHYLLDWLRRHGAEAVAVNLHHLPDEVRQAFQSHADGWTEMRFSHEKDEILLTAAPLAVHREFLAAAGTFVLVNGKIITDIDLNPALRHHRARGNMVTLVLVPNRRRQPFAHVETDSGGRIREFVPFSRTAGLRDLNVFTGIHLLEPAVLDFIPDDRPYDTVRHLYPELLRRGERIGAFLTEGGWREFSTLERYLEHNLDLLAERSLAGLTGDTVRLHPSAQLQQSVIADKVAVADGALVQKSVVLAGAEIGVGSRLEECVVGPGTHIPAGRSFRRSVIVARGPDEEVPGTQPEEGLAWRSLPEKARDGTP
jgi:NDP-sugar pyrophosphorylase family protein